MEIVLSPVVILQVNQLLETKKAFESAISEPFGLLLFGEVSQSDVLIQHGLELPLFDENHTLNYHSEVLNKRIELLHSVFPHLQPLGIIFLGESFYPCSFNKILDALTKEVVTLKCFLIYTLQGNKLDIRCHQIDGPRNQLPLRLPNNDTLLAAIDGSKQYTLRNEDKNDNEKQKEFNEKLISRINTIIDYLEKGQVTDSILRKVDLLVLQLKKAPTNDIQQQVLEKEMQLQVLNIICNQWEAGQTLSRNVP
ncbi:LAFA_0F07008g1_1 [Lachancea sp. 'fantastica']|nr:LAFA_0F07008g1_1 [Lachancea sp. 'fantastica']